MGTQATQKLHPDAVIVTGPGASQADVPLSLEVLRVQGQSELGLPDCAVDFHFANDVLFRVSPQVFEALKARYGPATEELGGAIHWLSEERAVSVSPTNLKFTYTHRALDREVVISIMNLRTRAVPQPVIQAAEPEEPRSPATEEPTETSVSEELKGLDWFDDRQTLDKAHRLLKTAQTPDEIVRLLLAIASHEQERSIEVVLPFLQHEDDRVFDTAMTALEVIGGSKAVAAVGSPLGRPGVPKARRLRSLQALLDLRGEEGAAGQIARALTDPDPEVRQEAAMNIALTGDAAAVAPLRKAHAHETDAMTRNIQARALELLGAPLSAGDGRPAA
ncbi:MAG: HEAT repeat domain-containing protein [Deltaproteobacteria bacterium]|nr:HEAT repeat domain-containing protein [Deltaproteobacteria bacterium]